MQWLPGVRAEPETGCAVHRLLAGTHTNREEPDHLLVLEVRLPAGAPGTTPAAGGARRESVRIARALPHDGEVNRARSMPQNSALVATLSPAVDGRGQAFVYNISDDGSSSSSSSIAAAAAAARGPVQRLGGMRAEGYGLAWSPHHAGLLAAGGNDGAVLVWDTTVGTNSASGAAAEVEPVVRATHGAVVEDVAWDPHAAHVLASVGDDGALRLWDVRAGPAPVATVSAVGVHAGRHGRTECNSVAFAPRWEHLYATGGADGVVALWDARRAAHALHALEHHAGAVYGVAWPAAGGAALLASAATDRRVMLWDITRIGDEQSADDANDGPPELVFVHSGHTAGVAEFAPCPAAPWTVASVDSDNALQVWQPAANIRAPDDLSRPPSDAAIADLE